jgi:hypothetical protein
MVKGNAYRPRMEQSSMWETRLDKEERQKQIEVKLTTEWTKKMLKSRLAQSINSKAGSKLNKCDIGAREVASKNMTIERKTHLVPQDRVYQNQDPSSKHFLRLS